MKSPLQKRNSLCATLLEAENEKGSINGIFAVDVKKIGPDDFENVALEQMRTTYNTSQEDVSFEDASLSSGLLKNRLMKWFTWAIVCVMSLATIWSIAPHMMSPGESLFGLSMTILLCFIAEDLIARIPMCEGIPPLPKLLASLLMGVLLANLPEPVNVAATIDPQWSLILRTFALVVILTQAGLELDPEAMARVKWAVVRLAFLPCLGEAITVGVFARVILGFPWDWGFMLGFLVAAVSPAVVIPSLIRLQEKGYGVAKGIPSLVMAASGIDDVLAIAGFTVLIGVAMPTKLEEEVIGESSDQLYPINNDSIGILSSTAVYQNGSHQTENPNAIPQDRNAGMELVGALVEVVIGVVAGVASGFFLAYVPSKSMKYKNFCRGFLLISVGTLAVFGTEHWGIPGSGALWALLTSFIAALHWKEDCESLEQFWHYMWKIFQPVLFGLTGATIQISMLDGETVGLGLAVLLTGIVARMLVSTSVTFGLDFNLKERAFVSIAWIPKGTVQAALGSAALDTALALGRPQEEVRFGEQMLVLAVLVTLLTAPIGAFGISLSGPKLLDVSTEDDEIDQESERSSSSIGQDFEHRRTSALEILNRNRAYTDDNGSAVDTPRASNI